MKLADEIGATGTPAFRINGTTLRGAMPIDAFQSIIDGELSATAELLRQGVPVEDLYARRVAVNLTIEPEQAQEEEPIPEEDTTIWRMPADGAPFRGAPDALVTMVEFTEFECPFCAMVEETLAELLRRHPGQLRIVFRHLPFHEHAEPAAQLAIEARAQGGDRAFFQVAERLFAAQRHLDQQTLLGIANDVQGTPHFFINGRRLVGAQPIDRFETLIAERLAEAERLMAERAIPAQRVYDAVMESARLPAEPEPVELGVPPEPKAAGSQPRGRR
jgi:protein-disulfide isomerase